MSQGEGKNEEYAIGSFESPVGLLEIQATLQGLRVCRFVEVPMIQEKANDNPWIPKAKQELALYFSGQLKQFTVPLDIQGTEFQCRVWEIIRQIPYGMQKSYTDIARALENPLVIRAAASANGKNPLLVFIPCHRVIGKNGDMVGYAGGIARKYELLALENRVAHGITTLF